MKKENPAVLVLRTIGAVLCSILLVVLLIVVPLYSTTISVTKPEKLAAMARDVIRATDIEAVIDLPDTLKMGTYSLDAAATKAVLADPVTKEILGACTEKLLLAATSEQAGDAFTADTVKDILNSNLKGVAGVIKTYLPEAGDQSTDKILQQLTKDMDAYSQEMFRLLPSMDDIRELTAMLPTSSESTPAEGVSVVINTVLSPLTTWLLYGAALLLAGLVVLCRYKNLNGLVWVGADSLIAGGLLLAVCLVLGGGQLLAGLLGDAAAAQALVTAAIQVVVGRIQTGAIILLVIGVALIAGGIVYKVLRRRHAAQKYAPVTPIPTE